MIFYLDRKPCSIFLGSRYSKEWAEEICLQVGKLVDYHETGEPLRATVRAWLEEVGPDLREKLAKAGLIENRKRMTLSELFEAYFEAKKNLLVWQTMRNQMQIRKRLLEYWPPDTWIDTITLADSLELKANLSKRYAEATIAGIVTVGKTIFNWAVAQKLLQESPFSGVERGSFENPDSLFYVPLAWYAKLLDACPDQTWRTLLALCRIGGLRNPSETLALRWGEINFETGKFQVTSSKTKRYQGKGSRLVPIFPELREELDRQFEEAEEGGSPFVIDRWRSTEKNMRTHFERIIFRAGLEQWPNLFQNLRVSRSNEILREYGPQIESRWIGHSSRVADQHYTLVLESEYQRAISGENPDCKNRSNGAIFENSINHTIKNG